MKKKTCKIIICVAMFMLIFSSFTSIFADTNPDYTPSVQIAENALDTKIKGSVLLDALANMINAIASLAEYLIGAIFSALTGDNIFPWADRIIFNGIGFLDINFLNPASNSLFRQSGQDSILGQVVKSVYSTVFSLAVLFLGVAVGVMAIRLAISSIAAEKAKYKQAIVNWATCIVMLFLMHYILAFVFWVNEQLVRLASGILIQTIESRRLNSVDFSKALNSVITPEERVKNFIEAAKTDPSTGIGAAQQLGQWIADWSKVSSVDSTKEQLLLKNAEIANNLLINSWYVNNRLVYVEDNTDNWFKSFGQSVGFTPVMMQVIGVPRLACDVEDAAAVKSFVEPPSTNDSQKLKEHQEKLAQQRKNGYYDGADGRKLYFDKDTYLKSDDFKRDLVTLAYLHAVEGEAAKVFSVYKECPQFKINTGDNPNVYQAGFNGIWSLITISTSNLNDNINNHELLNYVETVVRDKSLQSEIADQRLRVDQVIISSATGVKSTTTDIIANLGQFFKQSAYVYTTKEVSEGTNEEGKKTVITGWRASELSVTGALLYAIFIFQSCMYLLMYVKRLFYVMMLSMFGPIVVIYDFFMKSAGS